MQRMKHRSSSSLSPLGQRSVVLYLLGFGALVLLSPAFGAEALPDGVTVETASSLTHQVRLLDADAPAHHLRVHPELKQTLKQTNPSPINMASMTNIQQTHIQMISLQTHLSVSAVT